MEREEEERAKAAAKIDPRDRTWSGMVVNDHNSSNLGCMNDSRPRYSDYRDSVVAIVTDVVRFRAQLPIAKSEHRSNENDPISGTQNKNDANTSLGVSSEGTKPNSTSDKKNLLITAL